MLRLEPHDDLAVLIMGQHCGNRFLPLQKILRRMYEHDLKHTVIQFNVFPWNAFKAADGIGIRDHTEYKLAVIGELLAVDPEMAALPRAHPLHAFEHISSMSKRIFQIL